MFRSFLSSVACTHRTAKTAGSRSGVPCSFTLSWQCSGSFVSTLNIYIYYIYIIYILYIYIIYILYIYIYYIYIIYIYYIYIITYNSWDGPLIYTHNPGGLPSVDSALGSSDLDVRKRRCVHSTCVLWGEIDVAALLLNRVFFIAT